MAESTSLELIAGLAIAFVGAVGAVIRELRKPQPKAADDKEVAAEEAAWKLYFDGPLKAIFEQLRALDEQIRELRRSLELLLQSRHESNRGLQVLKDEVTTDLAAAREAIVSEVKETRGVAHDVLRGLDQLWGLLSGRPRSPS